MTLDDILDSHLIDADSEDDPFLHDDYLGFIDRRLDSVVLQIEAVTRRKVVRDDKLASGVDEPPMEHLDELPLDEDEP
jgi:hypothetical protein